MLTRRSFGIENLAGAFGAAHGQTGGIEQADLHQHSGLVLIEKILKNMKDAAFVHFHEEDVVRHPIVRQIIRAFDAWDKG